MVLRKAQPPLYLLFIPGPLFYSPLAPRAISSLGQLLLGYFRPTSNEILRVRRLATAFFCNDILSRITAY